MFEAAFEPRSIGQITTPLVEAVEAPVPVPSMAPLDDSVVVPVIDPDPDLQNEPLLAVAPAEELAEEAAEPVTELDLVSDDAALPLDVDVQEVEEEVAPTVAVDAAPADSPPAALEMESPSEVVEPQEELPPEELVPEEPIRPPVDDVGPQISEPAEEKPPAHELSAAPPARLADPEPILAPDIAAYAAGRQVEVREGATLVSPKGYWWSKSGWRFGSGCVDSWLLGELCAPFPR